MYNASENVVDNIRMLKKQTYVNFHCVLVDDMSTDNSVALAEAEISGDARFTLIVNAEKKYKVRNVVEAINFASPDDEDVIIIVDGDDMLSSTTALEKVKHIYETKNALLTYGSYSEGGGSKFPIGKPYGPSTIKKNTFRKAKWRASHLKTFKYKLFKQINPKDFAITEQEMKRTVRKALLRGRIRSWWNWKSIKIEELLDPSGQYIRRMDDKVLFFPMLEMAGDRSIFIKDTLYIYTGQYVRHQGKNKKLKVIPGDHKNKWYGRLIRQILVQRPKYET